MTNKLVDEIYKLNNEYPCSELYIYINYDESDSCFTILDSNKTFEKYIKSTYVITESFYRDLVKIDLTNDNHTHTKYASKKSAGNSVDNYLIIADTFSYIDEDMFPSINNYHNQEIKTIHKLQIKNEHISNLLLINNKLCIHVNSKLLHTDSKNTLKNELKLFFKFINN